MLWETNEILWNSQRDDWSHLYLYDLTNGRLKQRVTCGPGPVMRILRVDEKTRTVFFTANGREKGRDPYFTHAYRIGLDGKGQALLTPEDAHHAVQVSHHRQVLHRQRVHACPSGRGRAARRRRRRRDADREGRHLEAASRPGGSRPSRSR